MRYLPAESVIVRPVTRLPIKKTSVTLRAGSEHGCSAAQAGVMGPRVTVPRSPLGEDVAYAPWAISSAAAVTIRSSFTCIECRPGESADLSAALSPVSGADAYGVSFAMCVDQFPSAARGPAAPGDGAQVPSLLSPVVAPKNRPPQVG